MSWRPAYAPEGRGGFRRTHEDGGEDNKEESGEVHESSNNSNNNKNGAEKQHNSAMSYQPPSPRQQHHHGIIAGKRSDEEKNEYTRRSSSPFNGPSSIHKDFRGGGMRGPREYGRDAHRDRDIPRGGRGGRFGGGGRGWQRNSFSGGGRGSNDGNSHYGRDFRNETKQQPPQGSRDMGSFGASSINSDQKSQSGQLDREDHSSKNRGISRESSWDGRGGFRRSNNQGNINGPESSFGGPGTTLSSHRIDHTHRNDHRDGSGREPPFRDGGGGNNRDGYSYREGHPHSKKKASPVLSFGHKRDSSFGGDPPQPPLPAYMRQEVNVRDPTSIRGSQDVDKSTGSDGNTSRDISSSSYQGRLFGQSEQHTQEFNIGTTLPLEKNEKPKLSTGSLQGTPLSSRPTDPRRRHSISKDTGNSDSHNRSVISTVTSDDGFPIPSFTATTSSNRNIDVLPPAVTSSPNPPRRLSSYSSLADSSRPGSNNKLRSSPGEIRRATSDSGFRNDRSDHHSASNQSSKPWLERSGSFSAGNIKSNNKNPIPFLSRNGDPRFKRTDNSSSINTGTTQREDSHKVDPFGRSRAWNQPRPVRQLSSSDALRISPMKNKQVRSSLPSVQSSQSKKKPMLSAPKLSLSTSSTTTNTIGDITSGITATVSAKKIEIKPEPLPPLLLSLLGDADVIKRAEMVILNLNEVNPATSSTLEKPEDVKELPSKTDIMSAVEEIEKLARKTKSELEENKNATKNATEEEKAKKAQEVMMIEEDEKKKRLESEKREIEQRKEEDEHSKTMADNEAEDQGAIRFEEELKKRMFDFENKLTKAKLEQKLQLDKELQLKISEASTNLDQTIAKNRREMERSKLAAQKVGKKILAAEKGYKAAVESEKKKKHKKKKLVKKGCIPLVDIVNSITLENKRKVKEAHMLAFCIADPHLGLEMSDPNDHQFKLRACEVKDPKYNKTFEEWSIMAKQVTGASNCLYSEPSETPYYEQNRRNHSLVGPLVKEYVREKQVQLTKHWIMLAEEYEVRKRLYEKHQRRLAKKTRVSITSRKSILGNKETEEKPNNKGTKSVDSLGRSSNNPYRRARRGNEVRSEYEQEQIIAEIAAREAMEKRITHGGSKLPRQICPVERRLTATYLNTFISRRINDPLQEAREESLTNVWTDMEKCIFLDRFLQFPKDFRRIASFLKNKTTKDCVAFYYDSKQTIPYKGALKEHMMRRKRKGDYQVWDASIQAAVSAGALITAGVDEEKPVIFSAPNTDLSYITRMLHPLKREVFDSMVIDSAVAEQHEDTGRCEDTRWKSRKRGRDPLFSLEKEQIKFLRQSSQDSMSMQIHRTTSTDEVARAVTEENDSPDQSHSTLMRKSPKWTTAEKKIFVYTLEKHGRNWSLLSRAVGSKTISQIKNFYYDYKKQFGKVNVKPEKKGIRSENGSSKSKPEISPKEFKINADAVIEEKRTKSPLAPKLISRPNQASKPITFTPPHPLQPTNSIQPSTKEMHNHMGHELLQRQQELLERRAILQRQQELHHLQRRAELGMGESRPHSTTQELLIRETDNQADLASNISGPPQVARTGKIAPSVEYNGNLNSNDMVQQYLKQQAQQQQHNQFELQLRQQQQQQQQQQHQQHPPQPALHQIFSRHHQRDHHQASPHQVTQRSHEEARRRSDQQSQQQQQLHQQQQQTMSSLFSSWSPASQLLQAQGQTQNSKKSDVPDIANLQRLLQMQQFHQTPILALGQSNHNQLGSLMGLNTSSGTGLSAGILSQLESFAGANRNQTPVEQQGPDISALANAQSLLGYTSNNSNNNNSNNVGSSSVSDAFTLIARHMQRDNNNNNNNQHGFGGTDR